MKERIETIPLNEAFSSGDECPFCWLQRQAEQRAIRYTIGPGASYMEPEVRGVTDKEGFCGVHLKKLYDFGNPLGCALILQTYYAGLILELEQQLEDYELPPQKSLFHRKPTKSDNDLFDKMKARENSCFICNTVEDSMTRYMESFFLMIRQQEFRTLAENAKGFCMPHFRRLLETAQEKLPNSQREWFQKTMLPLMLENVCRVKEDLDWFVAKNDFRNASLPWKNARDALSRGMQKLGGGYVADPIFKSSDFGARK